MTQPIYDFTGRGEGGGRVVGGGSLGPIDPYNNEWVRQSEEVNRQAFYELLGMILPVHKKFGEGVDKLGQAILDSASGRGTTVAKAQGEDYRPGVMDRLAGLAGTWTGNAMEDLGAAFQMGPEDLVKLRQSVLALQDNPELQGELLTGLAAGLRERYGDSEGLLAAAEDFGSPGLGIAASGKAAGLTRKLISKDPVTPVTPTHKGMVNPPGEPPAGGVLMQPREGSWQQPFATPGETQMIGNQDIAGVGGARQGMPTPEWDPEDPELQDWLKKDKLEGAEPPISREGVHYVEGENVDPAMVPRGAKESPIVTNYTDIPSMTDDQIRKELRDFEEMYFEEMDAENPAIDKYLQKLLGEKAKREKVAFSKLSDDELDAQINEFNRIINSGDVEGMGEAEYKDHLQALVDERHRRRRESGGGSAGAKKAKTPLEQMEDVDPSLPKEYKDVTPEGGWIGKQAYNIENFSADADIGDIASLLGQGQFSTKRNLWIFPAEPDVNVFDINGFINRMGNAGHKVNTDELSVLADVLTEAARLPSKRNLSSMAEDLYKMLSGPTKEQLKGQQRYLFDSGTLGFNL